MQPHYERLHSQTMCLGRGLNSRVIEQDKSAYVIRVKEHRPPVQRPLAEVSDTIRKQLVRERASDRAREASAEAMARVAAAIRVPRSR